MTSERHNTIWSLEVAERRFLRAHGWTLEPNRGWIPPANFPFKRRGAYSRGHAVNAQKQLLYNPMFGGDRLEQL
jgi:hypothetical protein